MQYLRHRKGRHSPKWRYVTFAASCVDVYLCLLDVLSALGVLNVLGVLRVLGVVPPLLFVLSRHCRS